jgi:hypothetical protein
MKTYSCALNLDEKEFLMGKSLGRIPLGILKIKLLHKTGILKASFIYLYH